MATTYVGLAIADSMFPEDCIIRKYGLGTIEDVNGAIQGAVSCCNASHTATLDALQRRGICMPPTPEVPPRVKLGKDDSVVVVGIRGLPRLTDRHQYTEEEVAKATFEFSKYVVLMA